MKSYDGKVAIITGAGSGIGKALAGQLARRGSVVILTDVNAANVQEIAESLIKAGYKAKWSELDVRDVEAFGKIVEDAVSDFGKLDFLFNNAGIGVGGEARDFSYDDWKDVIDVNLYGAVNGIFAAYPIMLKQGGGHIVNTASLAGLVPFPGELSYTAGKYAIVGLSHALRAEAAEFGVNVTVVCPGKIETPIYETNKIVGFDRKKALEMLPSGISADRCAEIILKGVARNRATVVVTGLAKFMWILHRLSPNLVIWTAKQYIKKMRTARTAGD